MNWNQIEILEASQEDSFEQMCCLLFEQFGRREYKAPDKSFRRFRGAGGDGGVEAIWRIGSIDYAAIQAKWFLSAMGDAQWRQVKKSIESAIYNHPELKKYYVCIPRDLCGPKNNAGRCEEDRWNNLVESISERKPEFELILWDNQKLTELLLQDEMRGIYAFYFKNAALPSTIFSRAIDYQKVGWMRSRFMSNLHLVGEIQTQLDRLTMPAQIREGFIAEVGEIDSRIKELDSRLVFFSKTGRKD